MKIDSKPASLSRLRWALSWLARGFAVLAIYSEASLATGSSLEKSFASPPDSARPWAYWMWMDGNISRQGITADLEAMQRVGIGGVIIMEVDAGIPAGPVKFMSPPWRELFAHVVAEAERLGLQITLNAGPGWTGSGGPWVKPEQSMQHLVVSSLEVVGPTNADIALPRPSRRPAFFGDGALPPDLEKAKNEFYRDVAVLAFPTPLSGGRINDIEEKALYVRAPYSSQPNVRTWFPTSESYDAMSEGQALDPGRCIDLTGKLNADGHLNWNVPAGKWTIFRFGRTSTGANTRPAPHPGLGLESDKFDKVALEAHFNEFVVPLMKASKGDRLAGKKPKGDGGWKFLHIDSWEMGSQNWTGAFREEFVTRRGYDLFPWLATLSGAVVESKEASERFLWDLRQTAQELVVENHAKHLKTLGRKYGLGLSIEPYDMNPCADMVLGGAADVPMCEFWLHGFDTSYSVFEAASIAHTRGLPVVAAEAFTSDHTEAWRDYPATMKTLGDWAFCAGVNRIVFHRYQHQPWLNHFPGMTMGPYGVHWERTQTWWHMAGAYHKYLSRCQYMLRQGLPVADVCFLVAEGAPHVFRPPASALSGSPPDRLGYNFDACTAETLMEGARVERGQLVLADGMSYRVLVLPELRTMTPLLLQKIKGLVWKGLTVVGPPPVKSPGRSNYPECDKEVTSISGEVWGNCNGTSVKRHDYGKGHVLWSAGSTASVEPDPPLLTEAKWIWHKEGNPAAEAPVGKCYFRRAFELPPRAAVSSAKVLVTADNTFDLSINGQHVLSGNDFHQIYTSDVRVYLKPGANLLSFTVINGGDKPNPAGLIAAIDIRHSRRQEVAAAQAEMLAITTDESWLSTTNPPENWHIDMIPHGWEPVAVLGPASMAPWNLGQNAKPEPPQYGDFNFVCQSLTDSGAVPDFEADAPLRYAHRKLQGADIYFVSNPAERPVSAKCLFRCAGNRPELWDPVAGSIQDLGDYSSGAGRTSVPLKFEPAQAFFVVFRKEARAPKRLRENFVALAPFKEVSGPWEVSFDPAWGGPQNVVFPSLTDWSAHSDSGIKYYSGTALYRRSFELMKDEVRRRLHLDLGVVKNIARVRLNGRELGTIWCSPWRVNITGTARSGENLLEIEVANLWVNRLIGDEQMPSDAEYGGGGNLAKWPSWVTNSQPRPSKGRYTFATWRYYDKDSPLMPSGLLGPVRVLQEPQ